MRTHRCLTLKIVQSESWNFKHTSNVTIGPNESFARCVCSTHSQCRSFECPFYCSMNSIQAIINVRLLQKACLFVFSAPWVFFVRQRLYRYVCVCVCICKCFECCRSAISQRCTCKTFTRAGDVVVAFALFFRCVHCWSFALCLAYIREISALKGQSILFCWLCVCSKRVGVGCFIIPMQFCQRFVCDFCMVFACDLISFQSHFVSASSSSWN